ncbi:MAG: TonB-dependent receptor [Bacteroidetes bacterium]|nr:TonB-dependent receptor [Bacteroidota bacterium]
MKEKYYILLLLLNASICLNYSYGQISDTTFLLPEVMVQENKERTYPTGATFTVFNSLNQTDNSYKTLAEVLKNDNSVYIKSYGNYSIATASIRGAGASQNLVLWNGLPIESPTLGQLDLSLIPLSFVNKASVVKGGNSTSWGSAAIGGTISLENTADYNQNIAIKYHSSIGSFGNLVQNLSLSLGNKFVQSKTQILYINAKNDIKFRRAENQDWERQTNATFNQKALMQSLHFKLNNKNQLNFYAWLQDAYKEIPATTVQNRSLANQTDNAVRIMGNWLFTPKLFKAKISSGFFRENQHFKDPITEDEGVNNFDKILGDIELSYTLKKQHIFWFNNTHNYTIAYTKSYEEKKKLYRLGFVLGYKFLHKKVDFQFSLREEMNLKKWIAPSPLLGVEYKPTKYLSIKSKITRDYRFPTFNDLYWTPGGNINLKPEQGWSEEIGLTFNKKLKNHELSISSTYFNRNINNWIMWIPPESGFIWEAHNVAKVWSWGVENSAKYTYSNKNIKTSYALNFDYTSSTYQIDLAMPKVEKGDQLLYTPKIRIQNNIQFSYKNFSTEFEHFYISKSNGVNENIDAYNICNIKLKQNFNHKKVSGLVFFHINNILNKEYYVIERRPMAGINFQTGINIFFKHKKQSS